MEIEAKPSNAPIHVLPLVFASIGFMGFSLIAWAVIALLEAVGGYSPDPFFVFAPLIPLPAALIGTIRSWQSGRWAPFYIGLAVTLVLPVLLAFLLPGVVEPHPAGFDRMD